MKYLCVDMTGQCVVHVEGHQTGSECPRRVILSERFCGVDVKNILRAHDEVTQGDAKRKKASTLLEYACPPFHPSPRHTLPLVYSLFQFLKVDLLMLNYVTMVAFSGSD